MSFTGGTNLGSAYGVIKIGSELKGVDDAEKSLKTFSAQAEASAKKITAQFKAIGDAAKKAGAVLSASVTAPLVIAGKKAISAASDLNEALSATDVVFDQSAERVQAFAKTTDDAFGISEEAALSAAVQYSVFGKQAGLTGDALADFSDQLVANSSDLASFFNTDPTEALNAFRSGLAGEMEPLRRYGIILSEDAVKQEAYRKGIAAQGEELTQGQKVMARYLLIQEQMGDASGDFGRTSEGLANSLRRLQAIAQDTAAQFGQQMLPTVLNLVHRAIDLLKALQALSPEMQKLIVKIGVVAAAIGPALIAFGQFMSILSKAGAAAALLTGPLGIIVAAIAALALAWKNNWFDIQGVVEKVVDRIQETIGKLVQFLEHGVEKGFDPWRTALRALIRILSQQFGEDAPIVRALQGILRNGEKLGDWINGSFMNQMRMLKAALLDGDFSRAADVLNGVWEDIKGGFDRTMGPFIQNLSEWGKDALGGLIEGIKQQDWESIGDQLGTAIQAGLTQLSNFGAWVLDAIKGVGSGGGGGGAGVAKAQEIGRELTGFLSDRFKEVDWPKLAKDLIDGATRAVALFLDFQKWRFEKILQLGQFIADRIAEIKWEDVGQKILDAWRPAWDTFMDGVRTDGAGIAQGILDGAKNAPWDDIGQQVNDSLQGVLAFINKLGTWIIEQLSQVNWSDVGTFIDDKMEGLLLALFDLIKRTLQGLKDFGSWVLDELRQAQFAGVNDIVNKKGQEIADGLRAGIVAGFTRVTDFVKGINAQLQSAIDEKNKSLQALLNKGGDLMEGLLQGAVDKFEPARKFFEDFPDAARGALEKGLTAKLKDIQAQGASIIDGLRHGAVDFFNNTFGPQFLEKLPTMISDGIGSLLGTLEDAGRDLIQGLWNGISARFDQLVKDLQAKVDDLRRTITGETAQAATPADPHAGRNAGIGPDWSIVADQSEKGAEDAAQSAVDGYNNTLADGTKDIQQTQEEQIQAQYDAAAAKLETGSPSKLFERLGNMVGQGFVNGIAAFQKLAEEAGRRLAEATQIGAGGLLDNIKSTLSQKVADAQTALSKVGTAAKQTAGIATGAQADSDSKRVASAQDTTKKLTDEEITRAAAVKNYGSDASETSQADLDKRLAAEHDYARASIESERTRAKAIHDSQATLDKAIRDANVKRVQNERDLAQQLNEIEKQRADFAAQAESQLADLADQRAQAETQAAQQKADVEQSLQESLAQAEQQFNETQKQNLAAQQEARAELASQLEEAAQAWRDADAAAVAAIKEIKKSLKETLQQGREEFNRLMRDMDVDASRTEEDFQRAMEDLDIQRQRINEDLQSTLIDPSLSPEQRAKARIDAARQLEDLDRQQQDLEIQHQRDLQDAETARHDAELQHREEEQKQRDDAHQKILDQKQAEKDAEKAYHDRRMELENDAATKIGQLQSDLAGAAKDLHDTQAGLRDDAVKQISDIAGQEASTMADLEKTEQGIYDERAKNFQDLENQKTEIFRKAEQDRTLIAREEQKARDLDARTQRQAELQAQHDQRVAQRQLNRTEDPTDRQAAQDRGESFGTAQATGLSTGLESKARDVQTSGGKLGDASETGFTAASDPATLGTNWANSLVNGMLSRLGGARSAGNQLATAAEDGFRDASEMQSPSKVGFQLGALYGQSISMGISSMQPLVASEIGRLVSRQSIARSGVASGIIAEQQRALALTPGTGGGNLKATVVIEDRQLRQYVVGTAIAPLAAARDRVASGGGGIL